MSDYDFCESISFAATVQTAHARLSELIRRAQRCETARAHSWKLPQHYFVEGPSQYCLTAVLILEYYRDDDKPV